MLLPTPPARSVFFLFERNVDGETSMEAKKNLGFQEHQETGFSLLLLNILKRPKRLFFPGQEGKIYINHNNLEFYVVLLIFGHLKKQKH